MLKRKKVVLLRTMVLIAVVALLIALFFAASAIANSRQMQYMKTPALVGQKEYRQETKIDAADKSRFTALNPVEDPDCEKAAENDSLILYTNKDFKGIKVYEKSTGKVWSSYVDDEALLAKEDSEIYKKAMNSLFSFKYMELKASVASSIINNGYSADYITGTDEDGNTVTNVTAEKIFGGVRWTFDISELSITLSIDMLLDGDALVVKVPDEKIIERQDNLEAISNSKDTMEKMIEEIRSICEKVKSAAENNSSFSDSAKKAVQTNLEKAIKTLTDIKTTAGTSKFNPNDIEVLTSRINNTMKTVKNLPEQQEALQKVLDMTDELYQSALMISDGIPHGLIALPFRTSARSILPPPAPSPATCTARTATLPTLRPTTRKPPSGALICLCTASKRATAPFWRS